MDRGAWRATVRGVAKSRQHHYHWQKRPTGDVAQSLGMLPLVSSVLKKKKKKKKKKKNNPKTSEFVVSL